MRESRTSGSVRGDRGNPVPYRHRQTGPEARAMTYEEMVTYLLETYPSDRYRGDELMDYITAEIEAAEARGAITPEVREKVYRHFGVTTQGHGGPG
jgi:hypothetical protein